jgi:hypothetical protein
VTPLAAKLFRSAGEDVQRQLAASQFFECTALTSMTFEMRRSDPPESGFSENARLPARRTFLEAMIQGKRVAFACQEHDDQSGRISVNSMAEQSNGNISVAWQAAFQPGTDDFIFAKGETPERQDSIFVGLVLVEKYLCIINQPGLVERRERDTDKRVLKEAVKANIEAPAAKWHECRIRPGVHGVSSDRGAEHRERQLHYVRKHLKPSLGPDRWIDGYWRGNADLGIHLKWYQTKELASAPDKLADASDDSK